MSKTNEDNIELGEIIPLSFSIHEVLDKKYNIEKKELKQPLVVLDFLECIVFDKKLGLPKELCLLKPSIINVQTVTHVTAERDVD